LNRKQIRIVVLLGALSIMGIITVQTYFLLQAWSIREKQLTQSIEIALKNTAYRFSKLNETAIPAANPVHRLSHDYFVVDINNVIDANILEFYLQSEFDKLNLHIAYEYGIYDCHSDRMVYGDFVSADGLSNEAQLGKELPKYSEYTYYFGVRFSSLNKAITSDMTVWLFFTVILLLSVVFFAYSLFIIFKQKRWSELQKDFMNNMTHEFKTPISSIGLAANVISDPEVIHQPERLQVYGTIISEQNTRLNQLVDKVLETAKLETSNIHISPERINLTELVESVTGSFRNSLPKETVFSIKQTGTPVAVSADVVHLTNVIYNLTDNAIKYGPEKPAIEISIQYKNKVVLLHFSDNGPGIPKQYGKKIFQKFFRIQAGNLQAAKGFGLGLYYVGIICKCHGWSISLETHAPSPACFVIKMPVKNHTD